MLRNPIFDETMTFEYRIKHLKVLVDDLMEAGFSSKTKKSHFLVFPNSVYRDLYEQVLMEKVYDDYDFESEHEDEDDHNRYWRLRDTLDIGLPWDLYRFNPKKHGAGLDDCRRNYILKLKELRDVLKSIPVK